MKVFSVVDNPPAKNVSDRGSRVKNRKKKLTIPQRENVSADEIRARVAAHKKKAGNGQLSKIQQKAQFEAEKIPDLEDVEKKITGDVGANNPNDLATHGKLKKVLSMGAFNFSDKEKAALEQILKD